MISLGYVLTAKLTEKSIATAIRSLVSLAKGLGAVCASEQQTPQVSLPLLFRPQLFDGKVLPLAPESTKNPQLLH